MRTMGPSMTPFRSFSRSHLIPNHVYSRGYAPLPPAPQSSDQLVLGGLPVSRMWCPKTTAVREALRTIRPLPICDARRLKPFCTSSLKIEVVTLVQKCVVPEDSGANVVPEDLVVTQDTPVRPLVPGSTRELVAACIFFRIYFDIH